MGLMAAIYDDIKEILNKLYYDVKKKKKKKKIKDDIMNKIGNFALQWASNDNV